MFAMLVVATALTRLSFVESMPSEESEFHSQNAAQVFSDDDMTPDFTEQLGNHDHERDIKKRNDRPEEKYQQHRMKTDEKTTVAPAKPPAVRQLPDDTKKRVSVHNDEVDVVDREDHVTQYLADLLVNTDSEITSLQASETDDEREAVEVKEDSYFAFLTGQEKAVEVEGAWSRPVSNDVRLEEQPINNNVITFEEYKDLHY